MLCRSSSAAQPAAPFFHPGLFMAHPPCSHSGLQKLHCTSPGSWWGGQALCSHRTAATGLFAKGLPHSLAKEEERFLLSFISLQYLLWYLHVTLGIQQVPWALRTGSPLDPEQQSWNLGQLMLKELCNTKGKKKAKPTNGGYLTDLKKTFAAPCPASLSRINALLPFQPTFRFPFAFPENGMIACSP